MNKCGFKSVVIFLVLFDSNAAIGAEQINPVLVILHHGKSVLFFVVLVLVIWSLLASIRHYIKNNPKNKK